MPVILRKNLGRYFEKRRITGHCFEWLGKETQRKEGILMTHSKLHIDDVFGKGLKKQPADAKPMNNLEGVFAQMWRAMNGSELVLVPQYRFHHEREWRFDFAIPSHKVAFEIQGGTFVRGAHSRGKQQHKDFHKHNEAVALGWRLYLLDTLMLDNAKIADEVAKLSAWAREVTVEELGGGK